MADQRSSIDALGVEGEAAMRRGDFAAAAKCFEQIVASHPKDRRGYLALAGARGGLREFAEAHAALDGALKLDSRDMPALMMKGDLFGVAGDEKAASSFYGFVCKIAAHSAQLSPEARAEVARAKARVDAYSAKLLASLRGALVGAGYDERASSARFTESIKILAGAAKRYIEEPTSFFFSGLPAIGFYSRESFPWLKALEESTDAIAAEFAEATSTDELFVPYVRAEETRPIRRDHKLIGSMDWSALFLCDEGSTNERAARYFPKTLALLEKAPLHRIDGKGPMILFSRLAPGAHIEPHTGFLNTRLICHLPIVNPGRCALRVGNETREWKVGEAFVFNDTIEHEAWNQSDRARVILLFSIWRPELTEEERDLVSTLMQSGFGFRAGNG